MPMIRRSVLFGALLAVLAIVGCGTHAASRDLALAKLQVDMTKEEVLSIMGKPQRQETNGDIEVLFYTTANPGGGSEDAMPVTIIRGRLAGWGHLDYESAARSTDDGRDRRRIN